MNKIMIIAEQHGGKLANVSLELLGIAKELAGKGGSVAAALAGKGISALADNLAGYGADTVYVMDSAAFKHYNTECFTEAMYTAIREYAPDIVLFGATSTGRDLAPRLSARLNTGLTADCTKLELDAENALLMTRPAFGGNLYATIICPDHRPQMSTVRPGVMRKRDFDPSARARIISMDVSGIKPVFNLEILEEIPFTVKEKDIQEAKVLISCGRGASEPKTLTAAAEVAALLGGAVSSSRALVDAKIMPHSRQVGQTGKTVRPSVYMAMGISGAVQHIAGMSESEFIIAVNKDAAAPVFETAHLGIVSDANKVLPLLTEKLKELTDG